MQHHDVDMQKESESEREREREREYEYWECLFVGKPWLELKAMIRRVFLRRPSFYDVRDVTSRCGECAIGNRTSNDLRVHRCVFRQPSGDFEVVQLHLLVEHITDPTPQLETCVRYVPLALKLKTLTNKILAPVGLGRCTKNAKKDSKFIADGKNDTKGLNLRPNLSDKLHTLAIQIKTGLLKQTFFIGIYIGVFLVTHV